MSGILQNNDIGFFGCNSGSKLHFNRLPGHRVVKFLSCVGRNPVLGSRVIEVEEQRPMVATAMRWRRTWRGRTMPSGTVFDPSKWRAKDGHSPRSPRLLAEDPFLALTARSWGRSRRAAKGR